MPRVRSTPVSSVVAALLLPAAVTAKDEHPTVASESRHIERLGPIEKKRLQALVADVAAAGSLTASDVSGSTARRGLDPRRRLSGVGSGALESAKIVSDTSRLPGRVRGQFAALRWER